MFKPASVRRLPPPATGVGPTAQFKQSLDCIQCSRPVDTAPAARHATAIFGAKGFAAASTRDICGAAGVHIASIQDYFCDKQGPYRKVLFRPLAESRAEFSGLDDPALSFD